MKRLPWSSGLMFLALATAAPAASRSWERLPPPIARWIHLHVSDVPVFHHMESWLDDYTQWPDSFTIDGLTGYRQTTCSRGADVSITCGSHLPAESLAWDYLHMHFVVSPSGSLGPGFVWSRRGQVLRRVWRLPTYEESWYTYYTAGGLKSYFFYPDVGAMDDSVQVIKEYFDPRGDLKGVSLAGRVGGKLREWTFWEGRDMKPKDLDRKVSELYRRYDPKGL